MSLKKRIQESSRLISDLFRGGETKSSIARTLIQNFGLDYSANREDYVRREVSRVLASPDPESNTSSYSYGMDSEEKQVSEEVNSALAEEVEEI